MIALLSLILGFISILLIPAIALLVRGAIKWTRTESKLDSVVSKLDEIVKDKDKVHAAIIDQMKEDRSATNRRLEMLEQIWITRGSQKL